MMDYPNGLHHYPMISVRCSPRNLSHPSVQHVIFCGDRMEAKVYRWCDPLFPTPSHGIGYTDLTKQAARDGFGA